SQIPFKGVHETAIAYEIVNVDSPPLSSIKPEIPTELDGIVLECLEKDPKERTQSASQVALDLKRYRRESSRSRASRIMTARTTSSRASATVSSGSSSEIDVSVHLDLTRIYQIVAIVGVVLAMTFFVLWAPWSSGRVGNTAVTRTTVKLPDTYELRFSWWGSPIAISPDGKTIAYVGASQDSLTSKIFVRSLDSFESKAIVDGQGFMIKFSPDGQSIVFNKNGFLQKVSINGGSPVKIAKADAVTGMGWGPEGDLYFVNSPSDGVSRLRPGNDSSETVAMPDTSRQEISLRFPDLLPDGKAMLLTVKYLSTGTFDDANIDILDMSTGKRKTIISGGSAARYVPTGHIVYVRGGSFFSVPFDAGSREITGPTRELFAGGMLALESGSAMFDISENGTLVYASGGPAPTQQQTVEWLTMKNVRIPVITSSRAFSAASLSPDGTRIALQINAANNDIWLYDLKRGFLQRLTFAGGNNGGPIWSPDGKSIIYNNDRSNWTQIFSVPANGAGFPELLLGEKGINLFPVNFSPDERNLLYYRDSPRDRRGNSEIWVLPMAQPHTPFRVFREFPHMLGPNISPNGKWVLYGSNETGKLVTYVVPFPKGEGKWQISTGQSYGRWWSKDGDEIFYLDDAFRFYAVPVQSGESLNPGTPRLLTTIAPENRTDVSGAEFNPVSMRWLLIKAPKWHFPSEVNVVTGWFEELEKMKK
ncbi:MAG: PD40 domain-containing protein, partial [Ignavibacteriales bacterium]|nr:PD40 domain-containing protein [Ignavibacteriales bacterium]